ncbi:Asp-tRNA(Asn)/Glu-tRNA(Gln) amidotransferase subunit GatB [Haliangium ochraceum]|uniref:Aspartyl/glutamyl-tRNA(Asn/Gln) amidotransferase subunit B n=1 Tax=Haliangium ochraceum (strain DSM 14365 / JCM 11303 / SMP-2) TaxID=502025 RepID=D0LUA7_HALO1|nr:Asp-tRNA(Asn)/Glu-tRNA(Gln) amidotransferase subunit GatB [Haliangium ochraceum]ACY19230.1 glutamyl-tRNA(Gln) amidotransferase, B subunit [Haliangium ochraceum DSM 14365]
MSAWEAVIGLEVHVQLGTASKAFSGSAVEFGAEPNTLVDPTVLGLPGSLPVFNRQACALAVRLGLALGCRIRSESRFARKHYFYPDLPKGYQISQFDEPLCEGGAIEFFLGDEFRSVPLTRIHLEEDAGKNIHQAGGTSLVDLNRAGVPLCEVVSEPALGSAEEAAEYMRALQRVVRYLGISDGDMEKGQLRCDANVSIRPRGETALGTRAELKNINSFRFVQHAIEHEIARQIRIRESGGTLVQETRLWDSDAGVSRSMRSKEESEDYRYFPDPDLPVLAVDAAFLEQVRAELPELPSARHRRYVGDFGLSADDARTLSAERELAEYFDAAVDAYGGAAGAKPLANWIQSELLRELNRESRSVAECAIAPAHLAELVRMIDDGTISGKIAKRVFGDMYSSGDAPAVIVEREGLTQISDEGAIEAVVRHVVEANPGQAAGYRGGKTKLIGFFVGQVMKETGGQANPKLVNELLRRVLDS